MGVSKYEKHLMSDYKSDFRVHPAAPLIFVHPQYRFIAARHISFGAAITHQKLMTIRQ
ncbi:MAG: hypothetical protein ABI767_01615 [Rhodanobacter sp.]